jgi:hypothetical protein
MDSAFTKQNVLNLFLPKGQMTLERVLYQSVVGPIGQPASEAVYLAIGTTDGNALHNYQIRMAPEDMPPATAFWSVTLYDTENGFFIPNDRKKYSVGENSGMRLDADDGITIYIAAKRPKDEREENWLPLNRGNYGIDIVMRLYTPDTERYKTWTVPKAEKIS